MQCSNIARSGYSCLCCIWRIQTWNEIKRKVTYWPEELTVSYFIMAYRRSNMAADNKSTSSSSTLDWNSEPPLSPTSPSHLTHFKPLTPDQDEPPLRSAYSSLVSLFRFNKGDSYSFHKPSWEPLPFLIAGSDSFRSLRDCTLSRVNNYVYVWRTIKIWEIYLCFAFTYHKIWDLLTFG